MDETRMDVPEVGEQTPKKLSIPCVPISPPICVACRAEMQTARCTRCDHVFLVCHQGYAAKLAIGTVALCASCMCTVLTEWGLENLKGLGENSEA